MIFDTLEYWHFLADGSLLSRIERYKYLGNLRSFSVQSSDLSAVVYNVMTEYSDLMYFLFIGKIGTE